MPTTDVDAALLSLQRDLRDLAAVHRVSLRGRVSAAARMRRVLDDLLVALVIEARNPQGWETGWWAHGQSGDVTWEELGQALGMSRQGAQRRYGAAVAARYGDQGRPR